MSSQPSSSRPGSADRSSVLLFLLISLGLFVAVAKSGFVRIRHLEILRRHGNSATSITVMQAVNAGTPRQLACSNGTVWDLGNRVGRNDDELLEAAGTDILVVGAGPHPIAGLDGMNVLANPSTTPDISRPVTLLESSQPHILLSERERIQRGSKKNKKKGKRKKLTHGNSGKQKL